MNVKLKKLKKQINLNLKKNVFYNIFVGKKLKGL